MVRRFRFVFELVFLLTAVQAIGAEMEAPAVQKWLENHPDETFQKLAPQWSSLTKSLLESMGEKGRAAFESFKFSGNEDRNSQGGGLY